MIIHYINNNLSPNIIKSYADNNNFNITDSESIIIYNFIKENYVSILNGNESSFNDLKKKIRLDLYNEIMKLYYANKSKYF